MSFKLDDIQYNAALKLNAEYRYHNFLQGAKKGLEVFVLKKDEDDILFRLFEDDEEKKNTPAGLFWSEKAGRTTGRNIPIKLSKLDGCLQEIDRLNQEYTAGVFFVVNGGGNSDSEVLQAGRAPM